MCACPPHLVEIASQTVSNLQSFSPFAGVVCAALAGSKFGQFLIRASGLGKSNQQQQYPEATVKLDYDQRSGATLVRSAIKQPSSMSKAMPPESNGCSVSVAEIRT